ncbi:MAG: PHP domain-containing protein [Propionibacteriaceae bacterium]|jgi:predicted metal-dependent phosphoesterase TrpH|nr:PHP domain-containing protein [Propionibacteriaceae bacterium]
MWIDLHVHSTASDGTDRPERLVQLAQAVGLDVIALTDHDSFAGLDRAAQAAAGVGLEVLPGLELSAHYGPAAGPDHHPVHVLGYGCRVDDPELTAELELIRRGRQERLPRLLAQLAELGLPLDWAEVERRAGATAAIGRPHLADAMVARGYVADRDQAFALYLRDDGPLLDERHTPTAAAAVELIQAAGGCAVMAHPFARGAEAWISFDWLAELARRGLFGLEVDHVDHSPAQRRRLRRWADRLGLAVTGASDYHGRGKTGHPLGAERTDPAVYAVLRQRLVEQKGRL